METKELENQRRPLPLQRLVVQQVSSLPFPSCLIPSRASLLFPRPGSPPQSLPSLLLRLLPSAPFRGPGTPSPLLRRLRGGRCAPWVPKFLPLPLFLPFAPGGSLPLRRAGPGTRGSGLLFALLVRLPLRGPRRPDSPGFGPGVLCCGAEPSRTGPRRPGPDQPEEERSVLPAPYARPGHGRGSPTTGCTESLGVPAAAAA